jgi:hypothetical protein
MVSTDEDYAYKCICEEFEEVVPEGVDADAGWLSPLAMRGRDGCAGSNRK